MKAKPSHLNLDFGWWFMFAVKHLLSKVWLCWKKDSFTSTTFLEKSSASFCFHPSENQLTLQLIPISTRIGFESCSFGLDSFCFFFAKQNLSKMHFFEVDEKSFNTILVLHSHASFQKRIPSANLKDSLWWEAENHNGCHVLIYKKIQCKPYSNHLFQSIIHLSIMIQKRQNIWEILHVKFLSFLVSFETIYMKLWLTSKLLQVVSLEKSNHDSSLVSVASLANLSTLVALQAFVTFYFLLFSISDFMLSWW